MQKIFEVRAALSDKIAELKALVSKEADLPLDQELPADDATRIAVLEGEIEVLKGRVSRLEALEALPDTVVTDDIVEADKALTVTTVTKQFQPVATVPAQVAKPIEKGLQFGRFMVGMAIASKQGVRSAADLISKTFGDTMVSKDILAVSNTGTHTVPAYYSTDLIELLRPMVALRKADPIVLTTEGGNLRLPRMTQSATANWQGETDNIIHSNEAFDHVDLTGRKLTALVPVSYDLTVKSPLGIDRIVRDDLLQVMARAEDVAFISGDGSNGSPTGLTNMSGIQSFNAAGVTLANATAAINGAVLKLQLANARMVRPAWFGSPAVFAFLANMRDGVGGYFTFRDELTQGRLAGFPVFTTNQIPTNRTNYDAAGTGGTQGSDLVLADMGEVIVADTYDIRLDVSTEAAYWDGTALQSAFSRDLVLFRAIKQTDIGCRHPSSIVRVKTNAWTLF